MRPPTSPLSPPTTERTFPTNRRAWFSSRIAPLAAVASLALGLSLPAAETQVTLRTSSAVFEVDAAGALKSIATSAPARELIAPNQPAAVLSLRIDGKLQRPASARWDEAARELILQFDSPKVVVRLAAVAKPTHVVFEVREIVPKGLAEMVLWGPYPLSIRGTVGEIVGVARDREVAVGIQALNAKTLGGSPSVENDIDTEFGEDDRGEYPQLPAELTKGQGFRGDTARATSYGSLVQAYCRSREQERVIPNWGHPKYRVMSFPDGGLIGSRIALFACPEREALDRIGEIEIAEGLPHPLLDGVWAKRSPKASASYLIVDFSEATVDRAIEMTRRAGLKYLYHSSPFATWGHFQLKPALFPGGWDGFKSCVDRARQAGVDLGFHTLSNFITPNDPVVTPKPHAGLAVIGSSELAAEIGMDAAEITVKNPEYFQKKTILNTVRIGDELIQFGEVTESAPWVLRKCQRGAFGTKASAHAMGEAVGRLLDHDYRVFLTDAPLAQEIARNIAKFCNATGARQLSFDGLEGNWASGYGQYGRTLFTQAWYDALDPRLRGQIINDASNPGHFNWHINTRMNWGEPWYAGFRESQTLYRFKNQVLFQRNYMPHMLGWFALRPDTSIEDAEWLLARAAGFDAGFALATSLASTAQLEADPHSADTARQFGATAAILATIGQWETARLSGAFPETAKALLRDNQREFQLRPAGEAHWKLHEAHGARFVQSLTNGPTTWAFTNPAPQQPLHWLVRSTAKVPVTGLIVELNGQRMVDLKSTPLPAGASLRYAGGAEAVISDATWKELRRVPVLAAGALVAPGISRIRIGSETLSEGQLKTEVRTYADGLLIAKRP